MDAPGPGEGSRRKRGAQAQAVASEKPDASVPPGKRARAQEAAVNGSGGNAAAEADVGTDPDDLAPIHERERAA